MNSSPIRSGTVNVVNSAVTPRPPLRRPGGWCGNGGARRVVVDLTNDSGVEDETVVDLTSPIRVGHIPPISDYIGTMSLGFPLRVTAGPPFQEGYPSNRPSCTLPVQLVESDEEVEEVNTSESCSWWDDTAEPKE
ncbi:hypothetical protein EMCRGX_G002862 [Ephydatia muelleri]